MSAQIPAELHKLKGTRPTRAVEQESAFSAGRPKMPSYLSDEEKEIWKGMVKQLSHRGTLTKGDATLLETFVQTKARYLVLLRELKEHGEVIEVEVTTENGGKYTKRILNPAGKEATKLEAALRGQLKEFGSTPASREKAKRAKPAPKKANDEIPGQTPIFLDGEDEQ